MIHEYREKVVAMAIQSSPKRLLNSDGLVCQWMDSDKQLYVCMYVAIHRPRVHHALCVGSNSALEFEANRSMAMSIESLLHMLPIVLVHFHHVFMPFPSHCYVVQIQVWVTLTKLGMPAIHALCMAVPMITTMHNMLYVTLFPHPRMAKLLLPLALVITALITISVEGQSKSALISFIN